MQTEILLSILIPTIDERKELFTSLVKEFQQQIFKDGLCELVELISISDNKEISIGAKRKKLYEAANGEYSVQWDDDDGCHPDSIRLIVEALAEKPNCVTYKEKCTLDGIQKASNHSIKYIDWGENIDGYDYVRTPFFKDVIRTSICQEVGVADSRYAEDHDFSYRVKPLLTSEVHIDEWIYYYNHISSDHNERYGIK